MDINKLRKVAEKMEDLLLEEQARREIVSYSIDIIPDDNKIEITEVMMSPIKEIEVKYELRPERV